jgi:hypothetical protein
MSFLHEPQMIIDVNLIRNTFPCDIVVETGTHVGDSIEILLNHFNKIYSCEINDEFYESSKNRYKDVSEDILQIQKGNSPECLESFFKEIGHDKFLLYLDAHWQAQWPLLNELETVKKFNYKPFIAIHDFDCGLLHEDGWRYDQYFDYDENNNRTYHHLNWEYIKDKIISIYGEDGYVFEVSQKALTLASNDKRGCAFIYPKI